MQQNPLFPIQPIDLVGINSRGDIESRSLMTSVQHPDVSSWIRQTLDQRNAQACASFHSTSSITNYRDPINGKKLCRYHEVDKGSGPLTVAANMRAAKLYLDRTKALSGGRIDGIRNDVEKYIAKHSNW